MDSQGRVLIVDDNATNVDIPTRRTSRGGRRRDHSRFINGLKGQKPIAMTRLCH